MYIRVWWLVPRYFAAWVWFQLNFLTALKINSFPTASKLIPWGARPKSNTSIGDHSQRKNSGISLSVIPFHRTSKFLQKRSTISLTTFWIPEIFRVISSNGCTWYWTGLEILLLSFISEEGKHRFFYKQNKINLSLFLICDRRRSVSFLKTFPGSTGR